MNSEHRHDSKKFRTFFFKKRNYGIRNIFRYVLVETLTLKVSTKCLFFELFLKVKTFLLIFWADEWSLKSFDCFEFLIPPPNFCLFGDFWGIHLIVWTFRVFFYLSCFFVCFFPSLFMNFRVVAMANDSDCEDCRLRISRQNLSGQIN